MSKDLVSSLFWLAIAIFFSLEGFAKLKLGTLRQPGPGFFPFWGAVILGTLSLILLMRSLKSRARLSFGALRWSELFLILAALLSYLLFLEALGFVIVTFGFLLLLFRFGETGWIKSAASSVVATLFAYALFRLWLQVQLPRGLFGL
ncbi:MAG TPA: tripartite tricarboxylate transporter TctB family protein [Candidatus Binatia bacterium]|jgi:putative tricarboxylic transport membrane protein|nr:tripartite tricarboxylate transporter TctB family protein [Candidatus Binatia bacterium]